MSDHDETGLRARMPAFRHTWDGWVAAALFLTGQVIVIVSPQGGLPILLPLVLIGFLGSLEPRFNPNHRLSWEAGERRALHRSVVRAVNRGQQVQLDPDVRASLLQHYQGWSRVRWTFLVIALGLVTWAAFWLVEDRLFGIGLILTGASFVAFFVAEGRWRRRFVGAIQSWPTT